MAFNGSRRGVNPACVLMVLLGSCSTAWPAKYGGGSGTAEDPYQIATAADLIALGETPEDYDKHFLLTADIDLDPNLPGRRVFDKAVIAPIVDVRSEGPGFNGVLDGNGHTIAHLTIKGVNFLGLFGSLGSEARVSHLCLEAAGIRGTGSNVGSLAGRNRGFVSTSYSTGTIAGNSHLGGLAGDNYGSICISYSTATVTGSFVVGGVAGSNSGRIIASYSAGGPITGNRCVGGFAGSNSGYITGSYSASTIIIAVIPKPQRRSEAADYDTGTVTASNQFGGLVGSTDGGTATASFWDVETSGQSSSAGGVGLTTAEMQDIHTFLTADWDFVGEVHNGTCDYWGIAKGEYPRLCYVAGAKPLMPGGLGTAESPYLIRDARDLGTVWAEPMAHYRLEAPVDLSDITWLMAVIPSFGGTFDGQRYVISNLRIRGDGYLGLFGTVDVGASISDVDLDTVDVNGTGTCVGGLAGTSRGTITGCHSTGIIAGVGVFGEVGGLVGQNRGSIISGGSTGEIRGNSSVGGLVGGNSGSITESHGASTVIGGGYVGGLVGANSGIIAISYSTGTVTGNRRVGGLVGDNRGSASITASYAAGVVSGEDGVGGLVGVNYGNVTSSYSTGNATGHAEVGGLAGFNSGGISRSYSTGMVSGDEGVGGLVGDNRDWGKGTVSQCLWDIQTSGRTASGGGIGKTTAEMQTTSTFLVAGWDFMGETINGTEDIWWLEEGKDYPRLWWEAAEE